VSVPEDRPAPVQSHDRYNEQQFCDQEADMTKQHAGILISSITVLLVVVVHTASANVNTQPCNSSVSSECDAKGAAMLRNCPPVAFIKRPSHGRKGTNATMLGQRTKVGSSICVYDPANPKAGTKTIFETNEGFIFDMSVSYDAKKLLFSFMDRIPQEKDSFHIWEINVDGTGLRQLTFGPYHDASAVYLPDGKITFCSTRVESFSLCQDFLAAAMFVIDGDGGDLRRLEYNTLCDTTPYVMDDGSILFGRWEYQDKNIFCTQGLWTINPDGTTVQLFYGNTLTIPNSIYGAKQIPNTMKVLCTMAPHHGRPLGAIGIIDRSLGLENPKALVNITPEIPYIPRVGDKWHDGRNRSWGPGDEEFSWAYGDPYPISENLFLVAYGGPRSGGPQRYRLFLMDDKGYKVQLYDDGKISCYNPVPLKVRPLPHKIPGELPPPHGEGTFFVTDIYRGLLDKGVTRGQIKELRVMSQIPKKYNTEGPRYHDHYPVMSQGSYYAKYCYGSVPVYEDGTAYFKAPAGVELYFIALDADGKEIRRMGTVTQITAGEQQGCVGCHESRFTTPANNSKIMKRLAKGPDEIEPPAWGAGPMSFVKQVQPVFDRYCVECHSGRNPEGGVDLSGDKSRFYNMAYRALVDRNLVEYYYINEAPTGNFPPLGSGSWISKLTKIIESEHAGVKMDDISRRNVYCWIDGNAPYYGTWNMSRPYTQGGRDTWKRLRDGKRGQIEPEPWFADFSKVYKANCASCHGLKADWINLSNPDYSRVLNSHLSADAGGMGIVKEETGKQSPVFESTDDEMYQAMLVAIQEGKKALDAKPRVDMPGARPIAQQRNFGKLY
jgi:mono/diheme cytochrome c family protein